MTRPNGFWVSASQVRLSPSTIGLVSEVFGRVFNFYPGHFAVLMLELWGLCFSVGPYIFWLVWKHVAVLMEEVWCRQATMQRASSKL